MNHFLEHRFTYKKGWHFRVIEIVPGSIEVSVQIEFITEDTFNPGKDVQIGMRYPMVLPKDEQMFIYNLVGLIDRAERHETREWFKVDGEMPFNPHREQVA
jgi:hypothetical protein